MKTKLIFVFALLVTAMSFAQDKRELKLNQETQLIEVTYFYENGDVSQTGTYTLEGKLQGEWNSYNKQGQRTASATYKDGKKVGKWFFWGEDSLREVDYENNTIASVSEWSNKSKLASH
ncbi:nicotinic acid mononucleotide adenyltransferase [Formosa sediminum]|uniref:Nicotinic acid mononucleotide adenyltransferase n=1 Tax=Formosa sediminum TaxID=2594004 RepID=A0A516GNA5_9FLAO|nr:nicotinic acid mononucleotide adenyltransferase [Formosa sediminum]QDO93016.1 nicotinic acid mononucleotide adenyltransferase [Formosa sediminum]